ncbi:T9SS type A sorting domain-containing protein (plasmid) [Pedobacter sp. BS3]|uniref:LamG-like jellyroll fold domain-containing protein n=1 Tax=Pedobacter sp. BS3 TaxID=2567937 RepID=UPI0011EE918E|nr:LamG-like jellyroll fold domain-containing protein [Pedobacter sp. BS3]TZF85759.1 T9SS type A sorting domain-containing protein [Pedobacter sp. BS3]
MKKRYLNTLRLFAGCFILALVLVNARQVVADPLSTSRSHLMTGNTSPVKPVAGLGQAITLESNHNEGILIGNKPALNLGIGSFTIEAWIKRGSGSGHFTIFAKQQYGGAYPGYYFRFDDNRLGFAAGVGISGTTDIADNQWHHVAGVFDAVGKQVAIYIDGHVDNSMTFTSAVSVSSLGEASIGYKPVWGEFFNGSIDEVRVWNTARTQAELREYMHTPLSGTESGLAGYWNFEEGSGSVIHDRSASHNDGTLAGSGDEWGNSNTAYTANLDEDASIPIRLGGSDLDNQASATAVITTLSAHGKLYQTDDGTTKSDEITSTGTLLTDIGGNPRRVIYQPDAGYSGSDNFVYQVNNGTYTSDNTQTVNLTINPLNEGPLPVSLLNFTAKADGNFARLQWKTSSGSNNKGFEIYRRGGGLKGGGKEGFVKIGEVSSQTPYALNPTPYTFYDKNPLNGTNYYKLVQIDNDGKTTELGVRTVTYNVQRITFNLYPNPTASNVTVTFAAGKFTQLQVADLNGRILQHIGLNEKEGSKILSLGAYPAGTYIVSLMGKSDSESRQVIRK